MVAAASGSVLVGIERLLFGGSSFGEASFAVRAAGYLSDLTSPVAVALLVGAVLLAGNLGPAVRRLKPMVYVAVGTLGLSVLFGVIGLLGGVFTGATDFLEKVEFLLVHLPLLGLTALALVYLLPKAAPAASPAGGFPSAPGAAGFAGGGGFRPDGGLGGNPQQPQPSYAPGTAPQAPFPAPQGQPQGQAQGQAPYPAPGQPQGAPVFHQEPAAPAFHQEPAAQAFHQEAPAPAFHQEAPAAPYGQPALPPAPAHAADPAETYGRQPESGFAPQENAYASQSGDGYAAAPAPYGTGSEGLPYDARSAGYGQAPAQPAEPQAYTPSPYVAADVQPPAPAAPYDPPASAYDPPAPVYSAPAEQQGYGEPQQAYTPSSTEPQLPSYGGQDPQFSSYGRREPQFPAYTPSSTEPQLPSYGGQDPQFSSYAPAQPEQQVPFYEPQAPAAQPYTPADSQPRLPFDGQAQASFPQPPENYGQPLTGYSGAEFARQNEAEPHYPAPDPVDARSQQIAHAYQQAESYQQQAHGAEPQLRVPEYTASPSGGYDQSGYDQSGYDAPFGHPQTPQSGPSWEVPQETPQSAPSWDVPQGASQSAPSWDAPREAPPAETTVRFDPAAYQGDPLGGPAPAAQTWDSQPIDPTAIYTPERSGQAMTGENGDRERVAPGQEQNTSWYGSDRREH
ncbi:hypothetical protein Pve01_25490 [Planomonospora venezuelensis]|nr:hypothetical protein Pve01_25490 [Planomonospora venezuelensis]